MATEIIDQSDKLAWLRARQNFITASDVPKILGLSKYGSAASVYMEKIEDPEFLDPSSPSPAAELGLELEKWLLGKIAGDYNAPHHELDGMLYASEDQPFVGCTRDGRLAWDINWDGQKSVELKTTAFNDWEGEVPPHVFAQVQTQAYVMDEPEIILGVCFRVSGERLFKTVVRDDVFIEKTILPACEKFWEAVTKRDPEIISEGVVDGSDATLKALVAMYPQALGKEIVLDASFCALADELIAIRETIKEGKERKDEIRNKIAAAAGDATMIVLSDCRYFNFKNTKSQGYSVGPKSYRTPMGPFGGQK